MASKPLWFLGVWFILTAALLTPVLVVLMRSVEAH